MEAAGSGAGPAEAGGGCGGGAVALEFPAPAGKVPRRIRRRMMEGRSSPPLSAEEIEAKLREAGLRRQQFHEWLSSKARPKPRSPSWSSQDEDLGQRLEAKLYAAEQKRLSLLAKAQMRLARLDELRQAAKTGVEMRCEKEREELGTKVESRVQQAKENRMRLFKARMQRRAAAKERTAKSLLQMIIRQNKYRECVRSAISQKRAAAERKRMGLLEAEKMRARARVMQVCRVAETVCHQRESERRILKEQLENRLQRAKRQRAEFLRQRGSPHSATRIDWSKHGELLSRKLARCWRRFVRSRRSTLVLARAFEALGINENSVKSMPFEQLALLIESATSLQTVKALLDRLECRFLLSQSYTASVPENIDHLLKRLASPNRKVSHAKASVIKGATKRGSTRDSRSPVTNELSRYPMRVVLCAYMILGHPNAVFSGRGEREVALAESAGVFVREFELLIKIILDGPQGAHSSRLSSPNVMSNDWGHKTDSHDKFPCKQTFRSQLDAFDKAWRSYLYCFVVWKVKDARALEEDLVRAACQLELSMMQTCKVTNEGQTHDLSHDMRAIQKQVTEDQQLLREKVQNLSGNAGIERMECALAETRSKFFEAKESGGPSVGPIAHISSPGTSPPLAQPLGPVPEDHSSMVDMKASRVVRSLFGGVSSSSKELHAKTQTLDVQSSAIKDAQLPTENEILVNEIVHVGSSTFANGDGDLADSSAKAKVKETMMKAFWDGVVDLVKDESDYCRIVGLVKEVRDELYEMAPQSWKQEIVESIDLDILSQVLESATIDLDYLGKILEFSLVMLQKLSAPAKESELRKVHGELLSELTSVAQSNDKRSNSFVVATVKGLRFVLEQIQILKREISKARIQMMEPIIKGPAGLDYLQKAFSERYGSSSGGANSLPLTARWISTLRNLDEEWDEHTDTLSALSTSNGLPPVAVLRTGSSNPLTSKDSLISLSGVEEQPGCNGEKMDIMLRLGLLKLSSQIEGLTIETVPETVKLNFLRLRGVQSLLQQIIVISTSMLVFRQILVTENKGISASELEGIISDSARRLSELLDNSPDAGMEDIIEMLAGSASEAKLQGKREVMTRVLTKSLQNDDPVFMKVSRSIYLAARGIVLGGSGARGRRLADAALRRVGASMLLDRVVKAAEILIVVATISSQVHGPWYRCLV